MAVVPCSVSGARNVVQRCDTRISDAASRDKQTCDPVSRDIGLRDTRSFDMRTREAGSSCDEVKHDLRATPTSAASVSVARRSYRAREDSSEDDSASGRGKVTPDAVTGARRRSSADSARAASSVQGIACKQLLDSRQ